MNLLPSPGTIAARRRVVRARRHLEYGGLRIGRPLPLAVGAVRASIEHRVNATATAILDGYWRIVRRPLGWRLPERPALPGKAAFEDASRPGSRPSRPAPTDGGTTP